MLFLSYILCKLIQDFKAGRSLRLLLLKVICISKLLIFKVPYVFRSFFLRKFISTDGIWFLTFSITCKSFKSNAVIFLKIIYQRDLLKLFKILQTAILGLLHISSSDSAITSTRLGRHFYCQVVDISVYEQKTSFQHIHIVDSVNCVTLVLMGHFFPIENENNH